MKKYFYYLMIFLIIGVSMQSCKEDKNAPANETIASQNANQSASWNQVEQQLKALDMSYGLTKNIRRSPSIPGGIEEVPNYTNWELTDMGFSWGTIIAADAIGAGRGSQKGHDMWGRPGSIVGAVVVGAAYSIVAWIEDDGVQSVINPDHPFVYFPQGNRFDIGGVAPIGSEIGELHNCLVKEMYENDYISTSTSLESLYESMCTTYIESLNMYLDSAHIQPIQSSLLELESDILSFYGDDMSSMLSQEYPDEMNIIKHYAYEVSQALEPYDWKRYTRDYMMVVDNAYQNNLISEESALMINGAISTLYCSKTAWNYIQPDPMFTNKYIIHTNNSWILTNSDEHLDYILGSRTGDIDFIGYPYIEDGNIKRIYVYSESPYNMMLTDNEVLSSLYEDGIFTNTTNAIQYMDNNLTCQPIAIGSYPIHSAVGYDNYVYIDLEQYID